MDGIIIINKGKNCTSHDVVYKVKKILNEKIGHTGTLDPNATGVLPLLVGKGTLISKYLINHDKIYEATIKLGIQTDTADSEGKIIKEDLEVKIESEDKVKKILDSFIGKQEQIPPMYSAIKVNGKKLYEYARKGETVEISPRKIEIYNIELENIDYRIKEIKFIVKCSKGTYIRSLCEDIANKLNTVGYMKELKRIQVGEFNIENSITIEELQDNKEDQEYINNKIITIEKIFENKEKIILNERQIKMYLNGVKLDQNKPDDVYRIYDSNNKFIGLGIIENQKLKRDVVL